MFNPVEVVSQNGGVLAGAVLLLLLVFLVKGGLARLTARSPSTNNEGLPAGITVAPKRIMTKNEAACFRSLKDAVDGRWDIYPQLPLWVVVEAKGTDNRVLTTFKNQIDRKRVDFTLAGC